MAKNLFKGRHLNLFRHFMPTIFKNSGKPQLLYKLETWHEEVDVKGKPTGAVAPWASNLESL